MDYESFSGGQVKHLEMIQAVIARLGTDSFLVKGWAATLNTALFGFAITRTDWKLSLLALVPSLALWGLDAYFLRAERLFRALYDAVRTSIPAVEPFFMGATTLGFMDSLRKATDKATPTLWQVVWSKTLRNFYALLVALAIGLSVLLAATDTSEQSDTQPQRHASAPTAAASLRYATVSTSAARRIACVSVQLRA